MAHEEEVMGFMNRLVYAAKHDIGELMAHEKIWTAGVSAVNNSDKALKNLVEDGLLEKGGNFYKLKDAKGNHQEHSRLVTAELVKILKLPYDIKVFREVFVGDKNIIPDALILTINKDKAAVWILEVMHNETPEYFEMKKNVWFNWEEANDFLSNLFKVKVKSFNIINKAEEIA